MTSLSYLSTAVCNKMAEVYGSSEGSFHAM